MVLYEALKRMISTAEEGGTHFLSAPGFEGRVAAPSARVAR
jgi:hypothetical protein